MISISRLRKYLQKAYIDTGLPGTIDIVEDYDRFVIATASIKDGATVINSVLGEHLEIYVYGFCNAIALLTKKESLQ